MTVAEFDSLIWQTQRILRQAALTCAEISDETKLCNLCNDLRKVIDTCEAGYDTRNIFLFLLLSGDGEFVNLFAEDQNFAHFVGTVPKIQQELIFRIILNVGGLSFLREFVSFSPVVVSMPVLENIVKVRKSFSACEEKISVGEELLKACFQKLVLSVKENEKAIENYSTTFKLLLVETCSISLQYNDKPNTPPENVIRKSKLLSFCLELCLFCLQTDVEFSNICWEGYVLDVQGGLENTSFHAIEGSTGGKNLVIECRNLVLSECLSAASKISVEDWISMTDISFDESCTMQQYIGNLAYVLKEKLDRLRSDKESFKSDCVTDLLQILNHMVIQPKVLDHSMKEASIEDVKTVLLSENGTSSKWFKVLLSFDNILEDEEAIDIIMKNTLYLQKENVEFLLDLIVQKIDDENSCKNKMLRNLAYTVMKDLSLQDLLNIFINNSSKYEMIMKSQESEFELYFKEAFNKVSLSGQEHEEGHRELVRLAVLDSHGLIQNALNCGLQDSEMCSFVSEGLNLLKPVSVAVTQEWLSDISKTDFVPVGKVDLFPDLVSNLAQLELFCRKDTFKLALDAIKHTAENRNLKPLLMWLTVTNNLVKSINLSQINQLNVVLAFFGQILEFSQQSIFEFDHDLVEVRSKTLDILEQGISYNLAESEVMWLMKHVSKLSFMTQCHFTPYLCTKQPMNEGYCKYDNCITSDINSIEKAAFFLVEVLPFITSKESRNLAATLMRRFCDHGDKALSVLRSFQKAIFLLSVCYPCNLESNPSPFLCLNHCIFCFGVILVDVVLPVLNSSSILTVLEEVFHLFAKLPVQVWKRAVMNILPNLVRLIHSLSAQKETCNSLLGILSVCPETEGRKLLESQVRAAFPLASS